MGSEYPNKRVTMFEKEDFDKYMKDSEDYYDNREPMTERKLYQLWKDGAEFGYNKANEWHKQEVDDIYDLLPEDWSVRYFICIMKDKSRVTMFCMELASKEGLCIDKEQLK